jgi:hypothetical protein
MAKPYICAPQTISLRSGNECKIQLWFDNCEAEMFNDLCLLVSLGIKYQ